MAMAQHLVKACRKAGSRVLLPGLSTPRCHGDGFLSFNPSSYTARAAPLFDVCRPDGGSGLGQQASHWQHTGHSWSLGLRSPSENRFFSVGSEDDNAEELSAEEDVDKEGDEGEGGDGDDGLQLVSETPTPLPVFKDCTEEAAYIGYRIIGHIKAGDFDHFKAPKAFAVVQVGSHQFKISPGDCIYTEKLKFADVNDKLSLEKVLLLGSKSQTVIGRPFVPKAFVHAAVEEQVLDAKVIIFKKKRRKNYRRTTGHRQELTRLRILEIWGLGEARSAAVA